MVADPILFRDLAYIFVAAVIGGGLAWFTRQPLILGYVVGGILVSPLTPGPAVSDVHHFELFAEVGVVLLMFSIGIEFSLRDLMRVKWVALVGGPLGMLLSVGLGLAAGTALGWSPLQGASTPAPTAPRWPWSRCPTSTGRASRSGSSGRSTRRCRSWPVPRTAPASRSCEPRVRPT